MPAGQTQSRADGQFHAAGFFLGAAAASFVPAMLVKLTLVSTPGRLNLRR
jgi:hypothetical protein